MDTLLKAAEFVELSSGPKKEENFSNARALGNHSNNVYADRRRVVSESEATERRRRPGGAGTRETHNKLEKNRRAHLKECFDILKKQVPSLEEKKTSNLNILRGALKHIQNMKKQEQEFATECDVLKMNRKSLEERLNALRSNTKVKTEQSSSSETSEPKVSQAASSSVQTLSATTAAKTVGDSRTTPISVATQTPTSELGTSVSVDDEETSTTRISTSSTDTGGEGDESEQKLSTYDDNEDEKTDTDEGLSINEEDNDQDIEIDVVGGQDDDNPTTESLHSSVKEKSAQSDKMNGKVEGESKRKVEEIPKGRYNNIKSRKRSKSEAAAVKNEEDSDYDENTKEEPKAKIQACARVSV